MTNAVEELKTDVLVIGGGGAAATGGAARGARGGGTALRPRVPDGDARR